MAPVVFEFSTQVLAKLHTLLHVLPLRHLVLFCLSRVNKPRDSSLPGRKTQENKYHLRCSYKETRPFQEYKGSIALSWDAKGCLHSLVSELPILRKVLAQLVACLLTWSWLGTCTELKAGKWELKSGKDKRQIHKLLLSHDLFWD